MKLLDIKYSFLAGLMVALGSTSILVIDNSYLSSLTFSCGLLFVSVFGLNMFTGKCGNFITDKKIIPLIIMLIFNELSLFITAQIIKLTRLNSNITLKAQQIENINFNDNFLSIFILACMCGICLSMAVNAYKNNNLFAMILVIFLFSQCSFQHSLANSYFIFIKNNYCIQDLILIIVEVIGNFVGSNIFEIIYRKEK